jgi:hypothetical protein
MRRAPRCDGRRDATGAGRDWSAFWFTIGDGMITEQ